MAYAITDFSHLLMTYTNDANAVRKVSLRTIYQAASQLAALGGNNGAPVIPTKHARRRYIFYQNLTNKGDDLHRHYPVALANAANPTAPGQLDGVTWVLKGYRGEQERANGAF